MNFSEQQKTELLAMARRFKAEPMITNDGVRVSIEEFHRLRKEGMRMIGETLQSFLKDEIDLTTFKEKSEHLCRVFPYWGFKGFSGQMQLNLWVNNIEESDKASVLKQALFLPRDREAAKNAINALASYISSIKSTALDKHSPPWENQSMLVSYFWEIQDNTSWVINYKSSRKVLESLNITVSANTPGEAYLSFLETMDTIRTLYESSGIKLGQNPYWYVEHVLWQQATIYAKDEIKKPHSSVIKKAPEKEFPILANNSWIPPILNDLPELANNQLTPWATENHLTADKAFEKKLSFAFRLLGYDSQELGQGTGREPDGVAKSVGVLDRHYAVVYDAKARNEKYLMGTNDRAIMDYIRKKSIELNRDRIHRMYFLVVSGSFEQNDNMLRSMNEITKNTQVCVTLLTADDLLFIVSAKLQDPMIDHRQLENLFTETGYITREKIFDVLGLR